MPRKATTTRRGAADGLLGGLKRYPEFDLSAALLVYGSGDGGAGPARSPRGARAWNGVCAGSRGWSTSTASAFFRDLEAPRRPRTPHRGELYLEAHQGTYTTQGAVKRHNRIVERMLHEVEALSVIAGRDTRAALEQRLARVLLNQFHDIIPGSSIERRQPRGASRPAAHRGRTRASTAASPRRSRRRRAPSPAGENLTASRATSTCRVDGRWFRARSSSPYAAAGARTRRRPIRPRRQRADIITERPASPVPLRRPRRDRRRARMSPGRRACRPAASTGSSMLPTTLTSGPSTRGTSTSATWTRRPRRLRLSGDAQDAPRRADP